MKFCEKGIVKNSSSVACMENEKFKVAFVTAQRLQVRWIIMTFGCVQPVLLTRKLSRIKSNTLSIVTAVALLSSLSIFTNLIAPFVDDGHVDIINETCHLSACRGAVSCTHTFVHIALNSPLLIRKQSSI